MDSSLVASLPFGLSSVFGPVSLKNLSLHSEYWIYGLYALIAYVIYGFGRWRGRRITRKDNLSEYKNRLTLVSGETKKLELKMIARSTYHDRLMYIVYFMIILAIGVAILAFQQIKVYRLVLSYPRIMIAYVATIILVRVSALKFKRSANNLKIRITRMKESVKNAQSEFINNMGDELCALLKTHANSQEEELSDKCTRLEFERKFSEYQLSNYRKYVQSLGEFNWCNFCSDQQNLSHYEQLVKARKEVSKDEEVTAGKNAEGKLQELLKFDLLRQRCSNYCGVRFWKHAMEASIRFNAENEKITKIREDALKKRNFQEKEKELDSSKDAMMMKRVHTEEATHAVTESTEEDVIGSGEAKVHRSNSLE